MAGSIDGNVLKTHKFKNVLERDQIINSELLPFDSTKFEKKLNLSDKHQINEELSNLQVINSLFILGCTSNAFYIFDFTHSKILFWCNNFGSIHTLKVIKEELCDTIYLFTEDHRTYTFQIKLLDDIFYEATQNERFEEAVRILQQNVEYFKQKQDNSTFHKCFSILRKQILGGKFNEDTFDYNDKEILSKEVQNEIILLFDLDCKLSKNDSTKKNKVDNIDKSLLPQSKSFDEECAVIQHLYCIYKSFKVSNFNLRERYSEFFDNYDLRKIKTFLFDLEHMIMKSEKDVTHFEAKEKCAHIYLNYINIDILNVISEEEDEEYINECLYIVNSNANNKVERCSHCNFPLIVIWKDLQYKELIEICLKKLVRQGRYDRLFKIVEITPSILNILLIVIIDEKCKKSLNRELKFESFINIFFSCADKSFLIQNVKRNEIFRSFDFWFHYLTRIIRLRSEKKIQCIRCESFSHLEFKEDIYSDHIYSFDFFFNMMSSVKAIEALELCKSMAHKISADAVNKSFYIKCLLKSKRID